MKKMISLKMIRYWFVFTAIFISIAILPSAKAVEIKDLYVAKVAIASQSKKDQNRAIKQAMRSVLVKVGGHNSVLTHQGIKKQLNRSNKYVTHFRYERHEQQLFLKASFDKAKINQLFVDENLPIWGSLRPQVILWLMDEQGLSRTLISESTSSSLVKTVSDFSAQRGLPIVLPLWDFLDAENLNTSDIWGRFSQPIYQTSKRYFAEAIVIVRISDHSLLDEAQLNAAQGCQLLCQQAISLDWSYVSATSIDETPIFSKRYDGFDRDLLLAEALGDITDDMYQRYALTTNENNEFEIEVANVNSLSRYVEISQFLQALSSVQSIKLISAHGQVRRFSLSLLGAKQTLLSTLKLNKNLQQQIDLFDPTFNEKTPVFNWNAL